MSALQSIDTALFRFINETLHNSFFDVVMPILAGGPWFLSLVLLVSAGLIWKGGARARLFLLMLAIVLPLGDSLITNRLKHLVDRPRPCRVLDKVRLPMKQEHPRDDDDNEFHRGCTDTGSMPSGHAANCFAAAMLAWIFYRRSLLFALPLASAVAFSRVYNGVHYPSDVLAAAILGAGYALALALALNALWRFVARRWFPVWFQALPTLAPWTAARATPNGARTTDDHWLRLGYITIAFAFIVRLLYLASGRIELSEDEAYQWLWSKHLALSYFSKPPLIAYTQWLGTHLFGDTPFGVRFFSPLCAAVGSLVALRFFAQHVNARAGFWLIAVITVTPLLALGSTLMTVDPLLVLFWSLAMFAGWRAVQPDGEAKHWALVGLWMGLAFLSKYTALLQWLCWAVFFVLWKPARVHLRRAGPYLALAINGLCAFPVIIWNAQRGWITVVHVLNDASSGKGWNLGWRSPLEFFGGAFGLLHPIFFVAVAWAAVAMWRQHRGMPPVSDPARILVANDPRRGADGGVSAGHANGPLLRFFFAMGAPLFLLYAFYSLHSSILLNWIAASVVPLFCLMVIFWERRFTDCRRLRAALAIAMFAGLAAVAALHETDSVLRSANRFLIALSFRPLPAKADPLRRVRGWKQMAGIVEREREQLAAEGPAFVIGGHYGTTGLLSFYMPGARAALHGTPLVYYRFMARPNTQFYFWPSYVGARRGQNAIYVQEKDQPAPAPADIVKEFASVTPVGNFPVQHRGRVLHNIQVFACRDLQR